LEIAEAQRDLRQHRPQPRSLHATLCNNFGDFGSGSERRSHEIEKVNADDRGQFGWRRLFQGRERSQVTVEEAKRRPLTHRVTCQIFRVGHQGSERGSLHRNISDATVVWPKSAVWPRLIDKLRPANIVNMFLAGMRDLGRAGGDDIQPEIVTAILQVMFVTDELRRSTAHGTCRNPAKRYESEFDARVPGAVVYYVQLLESVV